MSKVISPENNNHYAAWKMPEVSLNQNTRLFKNAEEETFIKQQLNQLRKNAETEGYEQGYQAGSAQGRQHLEQKIIEFKKIIHSCQRPLEELDERVEIELLELALAVAKQIIRRELKIDSSAVVAVIREARDLLPITTQKIRVYLHPEDVKLVKELLPLEKGAEHWEIPWEIHAEPLLGRGDCRIVTEQSQIDATIETRLAAIAARVLGGERSHDSP